MAGRADTIAAPATPRGVSALAAVRVSGPRCGEVLRALFGNREFPPRVATLARWKDADGKTVDEMVAIRFEGPRSFTGEDSVELYPHGNPLIVSRLLRAIAALDGCRIAEPGEFTRRAFENGKIDLAQAEAVAAAIHARTDAALKLARRVAEGKLSREIESLVDGVVGMGALAELEMDFAEEEAEPDMGSWPSRIAALRETVAKLLLGWEKARRAARIPRVALRGAPNAGKSSLVNALLGEERLLVSERPGTTRDWVETTLLLPEGEIALCDTAGLGDAVDELDAKSQERTKALLEEADLVVEVEDGTVPPSPAAPDGPGRIRVRTRLDLPGFVPAEGTLSVSSVTGAGLDELRARLRAAAFARAEDEDEALVATERQADALRRADRLLAEAADFAASGERTSPEMAADALRRAREELQTVTGKIAPDDLLNRIFSGFCIGK